MRALQRAPTESEGDHVLCVDPLSASFVADPKSNPDGTNVGQFSPEGADETAVAVDNVEGSGGKQTYLHERTDLKTGWALKREQVRCLLQPQMHSSVWPIARVCFVHRTRRLFSGMHSVCG